ncbi:MAG: glycosyltransferase family 2 protein [Alphaproteobacteria bacterium]|nr:glycosyltransferase family 2 protein [Alphaproteobacteria bacterium]
MEGSNTPTRADAIAPDGCPDRSRLHPSVSVVIPAHNAADTLGRALESVFAQTRPPQEVIVVDDGSTDATGDVARSYAARGVNILARPVREGAAAARNAGVRAATGDWVAFLDADDEWLPSKLERQMAAIDRQPEAIFAFCASHEIAPDGRLLGDTYGGRPVTAGRDMWKALLASNFVATPTVLARRSVLAALGGFDESLKVAEDQDMWIRLALAGASVYVPESLVAVHVRPRSLSSWTLADQRMFTLPMIERHLAGLGDRLTKRERRAIVGERAFRTGLSACDNANLAQGLAMVLGAACRGHRPLRGLLLAAKLPLATLYRRLRPGRRTAA